MKALSGGNARHYHDCPQHHICRLLIYLGVCKGDQRLLGAVLRVSLKHTQTLAHLSANLMATSHVHDNKNL